MHVQLGQLGHYPRFIDLPYATLLPPTGQGVRKLIKDGLIIRKPQAIHSRARVNRRLEAKRKGRHTGTGKRHGTADARMPVKTIWMRRMRVLRYVLAILALFFYFVVYVGVGFCLPTRGSWLMYLLCSNRRASADSMRPLE